MPVIGDDLAEKLKDSFKALTGEVRLEVYTGPGPNEELSEFARSFCRELAALSDKIKANFFDLGSPEAKAKGVERSPTVLIAPERYPLRYTGAPAGEEARPFLQAIFMVSAGTSRLSDASRRRLATLTERRRIKVFVSPT
jgi:thioredoxin reductase (NADPH)